MKETLLSLSRVANALNRSLVLPPLPCSKGKWKYCNVCSFDRVDCFKDIIPSFKNPVKESIFFLNEHVPERMRREDRMNAIVSFEKNCVPQSDYRSSFPAHVGHHHVVNCVGCGGSMESCAIEYGKNVSDSVFKLYSISSVWGKTHYACHTTVSMTIIVKG